MRVLVLFVCALTLGLASVAVANVPDLSTTTADYQHHADGGTESVTLFVLPNGTGPAFADGYLPGGAPGDGTVTLYVRNSVGTAIENFPLEDMVLASVGGGMVPCVGGATADSNTDEFGMTQWATPLNAGGYSQALCQVIISGDALLSSAGMALHFNSADINADGTVDLSDVGNFATDFFGVYAFRSDFVFNGALDLADVGKLAVGLGASCTP